MRRCWVTFLAVVVLAMVRSGAASAQIISGSDVRPADSPRRSASDPPFKVKIDFDRWHDVPELTADLQRLAAAWPQFLTLRSIGKSYEGRDIMLMTINNPATGPEESKAAMYIDANIHGNEIQGAEVCLYTIWFLMEQYGKLDAVTRLVNERVFYIVPTVNPDGRQYFLTAGGDDARTGHVPVDDDNDGLFDEDGPNDLNGNGVIEQMRKYVPGKGTHRAWQVDPRVLQRVPPGEVGDYILLGEEGIDDDGDGRVNEDGPGGYDANRNWGTDWRPDYIQNGSMDYPFQLPETRAVNDFLMAHPNIAGLQSYHNSGGQILRGPGAEAMGELPEADVEVYDELGRTGERMLPYYRYLIVWRDLYTVHGGMTDWANAGLGIISFVNELWNDAQYFNSPALQQQQRDPSSPIGEDRADYFFNDKLELGGSYLPWKEFDHPQYGKVEIGGTWSPLRGRIPPRFMNEELSHRNTAFTLYQADQMPKMSIGPVEVSKIDGDVYRVWVDLNNPKVAPTITALAARNGVVRPDLLTLEGKQVEVVAAGWLSDTKERQRVQPAVTPLIDQKELKRIVLREGHPGRTTKTIEYILRGSGDVTLTYSSAKGGTVSTKIVLKAKP
jgi:hypothetical protein